MKVLAYEVATFLLTEVATFCTGGCNFSFLRLLLFILEVATLLR